MPQSFSPNLARGTALCPLSGWLVICMALSVSSIPEVSGNELEQVLITGRKPVNADGQDLHGFTSYTRLDEMTVAPANLAELTSGLPGVAYTGQGGQFQTIAIRGLARQRVGNFFLDIPLLSERRAGTAASFIDPAMLSTVELVRGPASTTYGSGNIAGLIRSTPATRTGVEARLGWGSGGDENIQFLAAGSELASLAFSRRGSDNTETPGGVPLHTEFEQYNLMFGTQLETELASYDLVSLVSYGSDIGKSNTRYPDERISSYPRERHWLSQLSRRSASHTANIYFHYQDLETEVLRIAERQNVVQSSSLDFGARYVADWMEDSNWRWGLEYMGRRNVNSDEWQTVNGQPRGPRERTLRGEQDEVAAFLEGRWQWQRVTATGGLRLTAQRQDAEGWSPETEQLGSGYLGASLQLNPLWRLSGELSQGVRVANLSEKYFSGTTGRGSVLGNPDLRPESANSLDIGLMRTTPNTLIELHLYQMRLDDFIERVPLGADLLSFNNLPGGQINGVDFDSRWTLTPRLELQLAGHWQEGEDDENDPLEDVSPNQLSLGVKYDVGDWQWSLDYQHRYSKSEVAATEQAVGAADVVRMALRRQLSSGFLISVWGRNLLNEHYLITTYQLSTSAQKVSFGILSSWRSDSSNLSQIFK